VRPVIRRFDPSDLETARRVVSRAERRALDQADGYRRQAEEVLKAVAGRTVDAEAAVRAEYEAQLAALREELGAAGRRASVAENELELLRVGSGPEKCAGTEPVPPLRLVSPEQSQNRLDDPFVAAARASAARLHAQAELDTIRARQEAVHVLVGAAAEADRKLAAVVTAIESDGTCAAAALEQARQDAEAAARRLQEAEALLARAEEDATLMRENSRLAAGGIVEEAEREADRILAESRREAGRALSEIHRQLIGEMSELRAAIDRTRRHLDQLPGRPGSHQTAYHTGAPSGSLPGDR
jgi:hypothetical protein